MNDADDLICVEVAQNDFFPQHMPIGEKCISQVFIDHSNPARASEIGRTEAASLKNSHTESREEIGSH
jgi:hypothetical protein